MNRRILTIRMPAFFLMAAVFCNLKLLGIVFTGVLAAAMIPVLVRQEEKEENQQKHLEESAFYMEQLIYSFRKHHKIQTALKDVSMLTEETLNRCVMCALDRMERHSGEENLFRYALSCIEEAYGNNLMHTLHVFLIRVEEQGGDCTMALGLLLDQLREWKKNQKAFAKRKKSIQNRLVLSIVLSCLICVSVVRMMPVSGTVTELLAYQLCTGGGLAAFQILYLLFRTMLSGSGLEKIGMEKAGGKGWRKGRVSEEERERKEIELLYTRLDSPVHGIRYWSTVRRLERQIRLQFPEWMFDMILRLQTENVQTAIAHSLDDAPEVLVRPLYRLIQHLQADPVSIQPFLNFLKEFNLPEIHAVMLQLYAINDMGRTEIQEQIYAMLDQNQKMTEVAAELKKDSELSGMGMLAALPMMISVVVLIINLSLMLFSFLEEMYRL